MSDVMPALARIAKYIDISKDELTHLAEMALPPRTIDAKSVIVAEGATCSHCYLLLEGWVGSYTDWSDGNRSLTRVHMRGDLAGITNLAFKASTESIVALSPVIIAGITHASIGRLFDMMPRLASVFYLIAQEERVRLLDRAAGMLRLQAQGRIALTLLDLRDRYRLMHDGDENTFEFPLTQYDMADLTGLTPTHVNRVLQKFREEQLIELRKHILTIRDQERLETLADRPRRAPSGELRWLPAPPDLAQDQRSA